MTDGGLVILGICIVTGALIVSLARLEYLLVPKYPERRKVAVTTADDRTIRGILWEKNREHLVLRQAEHLHEDGSPSSPMDGSLLIYREHVVWVQVL